MFEITVLLLIGLIAGIMSGLLGIGGGIIIIPALVTFLGFSQHKAQGTSLGLLLLPIGILAVINYYKVGSIDLKAVVIMSLSFLIGSYFSSKIAINLPEVAVKKVFGIFLLFYAFKLLMSK